MSDIIEFLVTHAARRPDGCVSGEVAELITTAIKQGHTAAIGEQGVIWRSALAFGLASPEIREACTAFRQDLSARLWRRLDNNPGDSLAGDVRLYASAVAEDQVGHLIERVGREFGGLPPPGAAGHAALSVLLAIEGPAAVAELTERAPDGYVLIPCGEFTQGGGAKVDERPAIRCWLPSFFMARYPVTVDDVRRTARAAGASNPIPAAAAPDWPAHHLSWDLAATLAGGFGGRLPTEAEWEKAARGPAGNRFPWGTTFDPERANTMEGGAGGFTPVSCYDSRGWSAYGVADMVGNAWEWTASAYQPYGRRFRGADPRPLDETTDRVLRGGAYDFDQHGCNCLNRYRCQPQRGWDTHGMRLARGL